MKPSIPANIIILACEHPNTPAIFTVLWTGITLEVERDVPEESTLFVPVGTPEVEDNVPRELTMSVEVGPMLPILEAGEAAVVRSAVFGGDGVPALDGASELSPPPV